MLCLVWSDETVRKTLSGVIHVTDLYQAVMLWLGRRYLTKFKGVDSAILYDEQVLSCLELQFLKEIANTGFIAGQLAIDNVLLSNALSQEKYSSLTIADVDQYGLLKPEGMG